MANKNTCVWIVEAVVAWHTAITIELAKNVTLLYGSSNVNVVLPYAKLATSNT